ncbi:MAG: signal transduction histidine kinase [Candidatus Scalindua rubra]|uniref:histidine kinase n=1 Tax=Candidatus Scalindua rubra TaxID=1872076 RepID=A0A1E3XEX3_9BACT|nr:MAG: signal transduction histidine kinase [Candidatus Scalindua rubra]
MYKIRDKILVIFLSVIIMPIIIISAFFALHTTKSLKQDKIESFQQITKNKAEKAVYFINSIEKDIRSLSNNPFLLNMVDAIAREDTEQINHYKSEVEVWFKTISEGRGIYDQIRYIDEFGLEIVRVDLLYRDYADIVPPEELQGKSHRYYFKEAVKLNEGEIYVSKLDLNREHGEIESPHKQILRYAVPVFDREKQKRGILVLNVLADFLLKNVLTQNFIKGVDSYLLDKDGFYLLHPDVSKLWGGLSDLNIGENLKNDLPEEVASLILSGNSGNKLINKNFFNFIPIHFAPSDDEGYWIFVESLDKSMVYYPIYTFYKILGFLVLLMIVGVVAATFIISKRLTRPLNELVKGATVVAEGNLDYHINVESSGEIAFLAFSFNKMVYKLGKARKQLQRYVDNLEQKIEDRTKELQEGKENIEKINSELEDFIYIVSHDLKEPLFAIEGYTSRLCKVYKDVLDDKGRQFITRIKVNTERMNQKIREVMEVLKAGKIEYNLRDNDSGAIVKYVVNTLQNRILENKIKLSVQDNLPTVFCDRERMKDVFSNLLTNAIKFIGNGDLSVSLTKSPINPPLSPPLLSCESKKRGGVRGIKGELMEIKIGCEKNADYYKFFFRRYWYWHPEGISGSGF